MTKIEEDFDSNRVDGFVHITVKDVNSGEIVSDTVEKNVIKVFAKEVFAKSIIPNKIWDPILSQWVDHSINTDLFKVRYMTFGASFDENNEPIAGLDTRYYTENFATGGFDPIKLDAGINNDGDLINPIPISYPSRPLKKIEKIYFTPSYQPAGSPLIYDDIRAINNVVVFQTTLRSNEYNSLSSTGGDFLTITESQLVAAPEVSDFSACDCNPRKLFLSGDNNGLAFDAVVTQGSQTITLAQDVVDVNRIREGDQIKIVQQGTNTDEVAEFPQVNSYYLVINKQDGGRDITLDRSPTDNNGNFINGVVGILKDDYKVFSHRILRAPFKKNETFEVDVKWIIKLS
jgi:hypothetical protein